MRTADECIQIANDLDRLALADPFPESRADYSKMAVWWRWLSVQADWQDSWRARQ